jgi:hypothetical protein
MEANKVVNELNLKAKEIADLLLKNPSDINLLSEILVEVNSLKFRVINGIAYYDTILSEKRNQELLNLLRDEDKKKLLTSSTLTKNYLDGVLAEMVIPRETLGNMLKALYTSEENIRTLISKQKFLLGV